MSRRGAIALAVCAAVVAAAVVIWVGGRDDSQEVAPGIRPEAASTTASTAPAVVGSPGAPGVGDPYYPELGNGGYDVEHYDLDLTWLADDGRLDGLARIEATATQDLSRFNLDLAGLDVGSVTVDGEVATSERSARELVITPPGAIAIGSRFVVEVAYDGIPMPIPDGTDLFEVGWQTDGREAFVVAEPGGASTFFPVNDHPSDKATYSFEVTAPADQAVAANGLLVGEPVTEGTDRTWAYEAPEPMASYLVQVAIGDYVLEDAGEVDGVTLRHALHRSFAAEARDTVSRPGEMVEVLSDIFGPYPFASYGVVAVDEPLGFALETQTLTIIGSDVGRRGRGSDQLLLHELAHQWVGNWVSPATWQDIWLNEGFASYAEWLWIERIGGPPAADAARVVHEKAGRDLDVPPGDPGAHELFQATVYLRGALALQGLREIIGDGAFFELLHTWVDEHGGGVATTADLVDLAERVSGHQLDAHFDAWLYADRMPDL